MYVRTKEGNIEKICAIENTHIYTDEDYLSWYGNYNAFSKASNNIIDLIEVGDYVNGCLVVKKYEECDYAEQCIKLKGNSNYFYDIHVNSIVTKEQFSQMEYRVGD